MSGPQAERKVVTALFCDLVGSTTLGEELDVEDLQRLLSGYHRHVQAELERFGGTVEKFIGDAVVAVFGAPVAHEDDAERAVRAALAIRDWAVSEGEFQLRIAVNTGEALIMVGARPDLGEHFASGDVLNTAARLQSAAPVDGVLVGEATYRATARVIDYKALEPVAAKGKAAPVPVWAALGARSRFGLDIGAAAARALVGRDRELAVLTDALARIRAEETAQLVTLVGVPGIGKSRLVAELFDRIEREQEFYIWRQGRSLPYGETQSFWALAEIVKAQAGILEGDDAAAARRKLVDAVTAVLTEPGEREWVLGHLEALVGIAAMTETAGDRGSEAFAAWRRLLEGLAEERPLVLVFEDLHWADDGLLDFVDHLADWVTTVPMLIVGTARPELLERRPGWGGGKRNASTVSIAPLSDTDTARLLGELLEAVVLPAEVHAAVLGRAAGNPLYAEEYVRMLQDRGFLERTETSWRLRDAEELPLPETIQAIVSARLDALPPDEKAVLRDASVVGKVFWPSALPAATELAGGELDRALHALVRKEFVRRDRQAAVANESQYAFLHAVIREVTYGQIPRSRRARTHEAVAGWIEALSAERAEDRAEMLAHHYVAAVRLAAAAGEDTSVIAPRAIAALVVASERAERLSAWKPATERAREALELMSEGDPRGPGLAVRIAYASYYLAENDIDTAVRARELSERLGDVERAAESEAIASLIHWYRGEGAAAGDAAERARAMLEGRPASAQHAWVLANRARRACLSEDHELASELAPQAEAMARELGRGDLVAHALNTLGMTRILTGDAGGLDDLRRCVEIATESNYIDQQILGLNNLANLLCWLGRIDEAVVEWQRYLDITERLGAGGYILWGRCEFAQADFMRGEFAEVIPALEGILADAGDAFYLEACERELLAHACAARGELERALAESERGLVLARQIGDPQTLSFAVLTWGYARWMAGRLDDARTAVDELVANPKLLGYPQWLSPLPLLLVELGEERHLDAVVGPTASSRWGEAGAAVAAGRLLDATAIYEQIGARFLAAWATLLAAERGEADGTALARAREHLSRIGAAPYVARCERLTGDAPVARQTRLT